MRGSRGVLAQGRQGGVRRTRGANASGGRSGGSQADSRAALNMIACLAHSRICSIGVCKRHVSMWTSF